MQVDESKIKWRQFVSGDNESYSWIYTTYVQILYRYGLRFTSDPEIIKDCIQEVFTSLYKNRNNLITPDNIKVYLFVSLKNCLIRTLYKESFLWPWIAGKHSIFIRIHRRRRIHQQWTICQSAENDQWDPSPFNAPSKRNYLLPFYPGIKYGWDMHTDEPELSICTEPDPAFT